MSAVNKILEAGFTLELLQEDKISVKPAAKLTQVQRDFIRKNKLEIIHHLQREKRRLKVLTILAENPDMFRAFVTEYDIDPDNVILTIAIRNIASLEIAIPKAEYDPFLLVDMISKHNH